jgi:hypothetical protein
MESSWAREKLTEAEAAIRELNWAGAAAKLDVARLHLECAALAAGQALQARTAAADELEQKHAGLRGGVDGN